MASLAELQARLDALEKQKDSGVARVTFDGRSVEYRGQNEIQNAISDLNRRIAAAAGAKPVRRLVVSSSKGL